MLTNELVQRNIIAFLTAFIKLCKIEAEQVKGSTQVNTYMRVLKHDSETLSSLVEQISWSNSLLVATVYFRCLRSVHMTSRRFLNKAWSGQKRVSYKVISLIRYTMVRVSKLWNRAYSFVPVSTINFSLSICIHWKNTS